MTKKSFQECFDEWCGQGGFLLTTFCFLAMFAVSVCVAVIASSWSVLATGLSVAVAAAVLLVIAGPVKEWMFDAIQDAPIPPRQSKLVDMDCGCRVELEWVQEGDGGHYVVESVGRCDHHMDYAEVDIYARIAQECTRMELGLNVSSGSLFSEDVLLRTDAGHLLPFDSLNDSEEQYLESGGRIYLSLDVHFFKDGNELWLCRSWVCQYSRVHSRVWKNIQGGARGLHRRPDRHA